MEFGCRRCRGLERRGRGGCQGISGRGREEAAAAAAVAAAACVGSGEKEKERKEEGGGVLRGGGGTDRAPHLSVAAAGGSGGGTAPCPRTLQRSRPPTCGPRAAAEATGADAVGRGGGRGDRHGVPQTP